MSWRLGPSAPRELQELVPKWLPGGGVRRSQPCRLLGAGELCVCRDCAAGTASGQELLGGQGEGLFSDSLCMGPGTCSGQGRCVGVGSISDNGPRSVAPATRREMSLRVLLATPHQTPTVFPGAIAVLGVRALVGTSVGRGYNNCLQASRWTHAGLLSRSLCMEKLSWQDLL